MTKWSAVPNLIVIGAGRAGTSSPQYTLYPRYEGVPARIASVVPDAKLVYIVRDPSRACSPTMPAISPTATGAARWSTC